MAVMHISYHEFTFLALIDDFQPIGILRLETKKHVVIDSDSISYSLTSFLVSLLNTGALNCSGLG